MNEGRIPIQAYIVFFVFPIILILVGLAIVYYSSIAIRSEPCTKPFEDPGCRHVVNAVNAWFVVLVGSMVLGVVPTYIALKGI